MTITAMPVVGEIGARVVILHLAGEYTLGDLDAAIEAVLRDPHFQIGSALVYDVRASAIKPTSDLLRSRATWIRGLAARGFRNCCAVVTRSEPSRFGMARMLSIHLDNAGCRSEVFTALEDAMGWAVQQVADRAQSQAAGRG